jgi:glyoxylase-like metal-dependent hydrolase (beta-lactamase superfamily II)
VHIEPFFDPDTSTLTYLVVDEATRDAVLIDPVLDYDAAAAAVSFTSVTGLAERIERDGLRLRLVLETHAHADHVSGSQWLRSRFDVPVAIGARIVEVQRTFRDIFGLGPELPIDGSQFDRLLAEGEVITAGSLRLEVIPTPGHTAACVSYHAGDAVFTGDALFLEDSGVGRCDFPGGSADALYTSVHDRLYALPDATRVFPGHDYQPGGREVRWCTTIGTSRRENVHLRQDTTREEFVALRTARDRTLAAPRLLLPAVQLNIDAGRMPPPRADGRRYLTLPLTVPGDWIG